MIDAKLKAMSFTLRQRQAANVFTACVLCIFTSACQTFTSSKPLIASSEADHPIADQQEYEGWKGDAGKYTPALTDGHRALVKLVLNADDYLVIELKTTLSGVVYEATPGTTSVAVKCHRVDPGYYACQIDSIGGKDSSRPQYIFVQIDRAGQISVYKADPSKIASTALSDFHVLKTGDNYNVASLDDLVNLAKYIRKTEQVDKSFLLHPVGEGLAR